jgi:hypothetical protein
MNQPSIFRESQSKNEMCETDSPRELAQTAPPPFSRRQFLATSTTAAFSLASQHGSLSAQAPSTENNGTNGSNPNTQKINEPWTIMLSAINPVDGENNGADKNAFNWKRLVGKTKAGTPYLLVVRWCLEPECFLDGINKRQDSWQWRLRLLAQLRTGPTARPSPLPAGAEEYMVVGGLYYSHLLLDAGDEGGNMLFQVDKSTIYMNCVLSSGNDVNDKEQKDVKGKKLTLHLSARFSPEFAHEAGTLPVKATIAALLVESAITSSHSKWGVKRIFRASDYTTQIETSFSATFKAVSGAPDYSCALPRNPR